MKITPEIDSVARALCARCHNGNFDDLKQSAKDDYYKDAIAAIRALREPTEAQVDAERRYLAMSDAGYPWKYGATYTAMIDAALGENK